MKAVRFRKVTITINATLAQMVEPLTSNQNVVSSNLTCCSKQSSKKTECLASISKSAPEMEVCSDTVIKFILLVGLKFVHVLSTNDLQHTSVYLACEYVAAIARSCKQKKTRLIAGFCCLCPSHQKLINQTLVYYWRLF